MMMPPFFPPPPPQRSFARAIFTTLATSIFGLSIAMNIYLLLASGALSSGENVQQRVLVSGDPQQKIAVLKVDGIILSEMARRVDVVMRHIEADSHVKAVVVQVDTPGGDVSSSDEVYHRLLKFKEDKKVPLVVAMGGFATSGGYYVSCAADQIVAQRTTITGNIGVLWPRYDLSKLADKWGIEDSTVYPSESPYKPMGSPLRPMTPQEREYWLGLVDDAYGTFKNVVTTGRAGRLKASMDVVANGKAYSATEALKMGLVDQLGYAGDAYDLAASLSGATNKQVVLYEYSPSLLEALGGRSDARLSFSGRAGNGVNVNIDSRLLEQLAAPRLMYLWRGQ
jgi:protease-4